MILLESSGVSTAEGSVTMREDEGKLPQKLNSPGARVQYLRRLSGLGRKEFSQKYRISESTLRAWELDITPISDKLLSRFLNAMEEEGIITSAPWIRHANGLNPKVKFLKPAEISTNKKITIEDEVNYFLEAGNNRVVCTVSDNFNEPFLSEGDIVGGIICRDKYIDNILDKICIVQKCDEKEWKIRLLKKSNIESRFNLLCLQSHKTPDLCPIEYDVSLSTIAPLVLLRKINS